MLQIHSYRKIISEHKSKDMFKGGIMDVKGSDMAIVIRDRKLG